MTSLASRVGWAVAASLTASCAAAGLSAGAWSVSGGPGSCGPAMALLRLPGWRGAWPALGYPA